MSTPLGSMQRPEGVRVCIVHRDASHSFLTFASEHVARARADQFVEVVRPLRYQNGGPDWVAVFVEREDKTWETIATVYDLKRDNHAPRGTAEVRTVQDDQCATEAGEVRQAGVPEPGSLCEAAA